MEPTLALNLVEVPPPQKGGHFERLWIQKKTNKLKPIVPPVTYHGEIGGEQLVRHGEVDRRRLHDGICRRRRRRRFRRRQRRCVLFGRGVVVVAARRAKTFSSRRRRRRRKITVRRFRGRRRNWMFVESFDARRRDRRKKRDGWQHAEKDNFQIRSDRRPRGSLSMIAFVCWVLVSSTRLWRRVFVVL